MLAVPLTEPTPGDLALMQSSSLCQDESDATIAMFAEKLGLPDVTGCDAVQANGMCEKSGLAMKACAKSCGA